MRVRVREVSKAPDGRYFHSTHLLLVDRETGGIIGKAYAADTDEHWYEEWVLTESGKIATGPWLTDPNTGGKTRGVLYRRVVGVPFDIVDKSTGEVLAEG